MQLDTAQLAALGFLVTAGAALLGSFKWINTSIESAKKEINLTIDAKIEGESKLRHGLANQFQLAATELRRDVEIMKREGVRREEMTAMESRLVARTDKIEVKLDLLSEKMGTITGMVVMVKTISDRLDRLLAQSPPTQYSEGTRPEAS